MKGRHELELGLLSVDEGAVVSDCKDSSRTHKELETSTLLAGGAGGVFKLGLGDT
jgi:hypothetical protein